MKAMIFAAGLGTRLRPLTDSIPKALVPVGGVPMLSRVMDKLSSYGYDDIVVNVHHFPDAIIDFLKDPGISKGRKIEVSDERGLLRETGGGVRFARKLLEGGGGFLVHNVDILSDVDLSLFRSKVRPDAVSTILVSERSTQRYFLFDGSMRLVGWTNVATGEVRSPFGQIDPSRYRKLAFAGIHYMSDAIFDAFDTEKVGDRFSITDFYISVCDRYPIYGVCPDCLLLMDIGKVTSLAKAEALLDEMQSSRSCRAGES